jgi:clan AA aspartic protease
MSMFKVNVVAVNPKREELATAPLEALVDTGSELTWLPADALKQIGVPPRRERTFATATKQTVKRQVGYAILRAEGYETTDEVVFAEPGDMSLLGVRTLEGFGVAVDNIGHRFVTQTTIVADARDIPPEVPMNLPSPEEIVRRAAEAGAKAPGRAASACRSATPRAQND